MRIIGDAATALTMRVGQSSARRASEGGDEGKQGKGRKKIAGGDTGAPGNESRKASHSGVSSVFSNGEENRSASAHGASREGAVRFRLQERHSRRDLVGGGRGIAPGKARLQKIDLLPT